MDTDSSGERACAERQEWVGKGQWGERETYAILNHNKELIK